MMKRFLIGSAAAAAMLATGFSAFADTTPMPMVKGHIQVDIACMQTAVATRESALSGAFGTLSTSISGAYTTRASALQTAWGTSDAKARRSALRAAWTSFRLSVRDARSAWKTARNSAWTTFRTSAKACRGNAGEEGAGAGIDASI